MTARRAKDRAVYRALGLALLQAGFCACGCERRADSLHHLVNRSQGGDDNIRNLVPLAGDGTRLCHGALTSGCRTFDLDSKTYIEPAQVRNGIRAFIEAHPTMRAHLVGLKSEAWLDRFYPTRPDAASERHK